MNVDTEGPGALMVLFGAAEVRVGTELVGAGGIVGVNKVIEDDEVVKEVVEDDEVLVEVLVDVVDVAVADEVTVKSEKPVEVNSVVSVPPEPEQMSPFGQQPPPSQ